MHHTDFDICNYTENKWNLIYQKTKLIALKYIYCITI